MPVNIYIARKFRIVCVKCSPKPRGMNPEWVCFEEFETDDSSYLRYFKCPNCGDIIYFSDEGE